MNAKYYQIKIDDTPICEIGIDDKIAEHFTDENRFKRADTVGSLGELIFEEAIKMYEREKDRVTNNESLKKQYEESRIFDSSDKGRCKHKWMVAELAQDNIETAGLPKIQIVGSVERCLKCGKERTKIYDNTGN